MFIVLAFIATVLGVLWANKPSEEEIREAQKPPLVQRPKPTLPGQPINPRTQITFNAKVKEISAPILSPTKGSPLNKDEAAAIAQTLGFTIKPTISRGGQDEVHSWTEKENFLTVSLETSTVLFGKDILISPSPEAGEFPSKEAAGSQLTSLLQRAGLTLPQTDVVEKSRYISFSGPIPQDAEKEDSTLFELTYSPSFGGVPIVNYDPEMVLVRIWLERGGSIARFEWQNPIDSLTIGQEQTLKTQEAMVATLSAEGRIALVGSGGPTTPPAEGLASINVKNVTPGYLLLDQGDAVEPIFILRGESKDVASQTNPVWIYILATKEEFFSSP